MKDENKLLSRIAKALSIGDAVVETATAEVVVENEALAEAQAALAVKTDEVAALMAQVAELTATIEEVKAVVAAVEAEKAALAAEALAAKLTARKEKVVAAIGTEKADALLTATNDLDDAQFNAVVSAMAGSFEAEAQTALFTEVGVAAEADATQVVEESAEMKILKQKYGASK